MVIALRTVEFMYYFQMFITRFVFDVIHDQRKSNKQKYGSTNIIYLQAYF